MAAGAVQGRHEHRGDQSEDRGHVRRRPTTGDPDGSALTTKGDTMNVLLLLGLLITAIAAVLAMQTDEQSRSRH